MEVGLLVSLLTFITLNQAAKSLFKKTRLEPKIFHMQSFLCPNGKFPVQVASSLGFLPTQIKDSLVVNYLGNSYTASALMGLMPV